MNKFDLETEAQIFKLENEISELKIRREKIRLDLINDANETYNSLMETLRTAPNNKVTFSIKGSYDDPLCCPSTWIWKIDNKSKMIGINAFIEELENKGLHVNIIGIDKSNIMCQYGVDNPKYFGGEMFLLTCDVSSQLSNSY